MQQFNMMNFLESRASSIRVAALFVSVSVAIVTAFLFTAPRGASAAECTFVGTGDFNTVANWNCGQVPDATSTAIIPNATTTNLSANVTVSRLQIGTSASSSAVLNTFGKTLIVTDSVTSTGTLVANGSSISIGNDMAFASGGVFTANTSTVTFTTSTAEVIGHDITSDVALSFFNLTVSSTQTTTLGSGITYTVDGHLFLRQGITIISGTALAAASTTNIGLGATLRPLGSPTLTFAATTTNAGTIGALATASLTFSDSLHSSGTISGSAGSASTITFAKNFLNTGTFSSGSSTVTLSGSRQQDISSDLTFYGLSLSGAGTKLFTGHVTSTGNVSIATAAGTIAVYGKAFDFYGDLTQVTNAVFISTTGTMRAVGSLSQSMAGGTGSFQVNTPFYLQKSSGTLTLSGDSLFRRINLESGTMDAGSGTTTISSYLVENPFVLAGGSFTNGSGTIQYENSAGPITVASTTYYHLVLAPTNAVTFNLSASTTVQGLTSLNADATLDLQGFDFNAEGTISNLATITRSDGTIYHEAESVLITNDAGTESSATSTGGKIYATVQDSNRNLDGTAVETMTVILTGNSAAGSDSETVTLTETGVATGIFRNTTGLNLVNSTVASPGNSQFEITGTGTLTLSYEDNQDSTDTGTDTSTLTYTSASVSSSGGGGLSSSGGGGSISIPVVGTTASANLQNLTNLGIAVHALIKLPNDGDPNTQYDTAVYYIGADGKRHAFPNDKAYFTWYSNFDGVQIVSQTSLASIPLGANVTYKPGVRMVKFMTDPKVYAVDKMGVLRWITSETLAVQLYGADWNTMIDDISDAFYTNYSFGTQITTQTDFSPMATQLSVAQPSESLPL